MTPEREKEIRDLLSNNPKPSIGDQITHGHCIFLLIAWDVMAEVLDEINRLREIGSGGSVPLMSVRNRTDDCPNSDGRQLDEIESKEQQPHEWTECIRGEED